MAAPAPSISQPEFGTVLEPLQADHAEPLFHLTNDPELWMFWPFDRPSTIGDFLVIIEEALAGAQSGTERPYVIVQRETGIVMGSTRFMNISREHRAMEIGLTWIGRGWHRTLVNLESKTTLLSHAFEDLGAVRVQLKVDTRNERSKRAITRIGATYEGTLRKDRVLAGGTARDTDYFSIVDDDWPKVRSKLAEARCHAVAECTDGGRPPGRRDISWTSNPQEGQTP